MPLENRAQRQGREAGEAQARSRDRAKRADALAEARHGMTDSLRQAAANGPRRRTLDQSQATPEQREAVDARRKGLDGGDQGELTREERNELMNSGLRDVLFARQEDEEDR